MIRKLRTCWSLIYIRSVFDDANRKNITVFDVLETRFYITRCEKLWLVRRMCPSRLLTKITDDVYWSYAGAFPQLIHFEDAFRKYYYVRKGGTNDRRTGRNRSKKIPSEVTDW